MINIPPNLIHKIRTRKFTKLNYQLVSLISDLNLFVFHNGYMPYTSNKFDKNSIDEEIKKNLDTEKPKKVPFGRSTIVIYQSDDTVF